jgi:hypothetical protein
MMKKAALTATLTLICLAACTTPSYTATGERPAPGELASFGNLSYSLNYTNQTLDYKVALLTPRPLQTTTKDVSVTKDTLTISTDTTNPTQQQIIVATTVTGSLDAPRPQYLVVTGDTPGATSNRRRINWQPMTLQ